MKPVLNTTLFLRKGQAANGLDLEVTYYNDNISEVLQPHLVQPNDSWVSYHLPQPAAVTEVQIRAVGNKSLALCEVIVLGGEGDGWNLVTEDPYTLKVQRNVVY